MADEIQTTDPKREEWLIRLRFEATQDEARQILEVVSNAVGKHGTIASLKRDDAPETTAY